MIQLFFRGNRHVSRTCDSKWSIQARQMNWVRSMKSRRPKKSQLNPRNGVSLRRPLCLRPRVGRHASNTRESRLPALSSTWQCLTMRLAGSNFTQRTFGRFVVLGLVLGAIKTSAMAQSLRSSTTVEPLVTHEICFFNPETREGIHQFEVVSGIQALLIALHGEAFSPVTLEVCADGVDNNCDGQIDEGCSASDRLKWGKTHDCDLCMRDHCIRYTKRCEAREDCISGIQCVVEKRCMHKTWGQATCVCGELSPDCEIDGSRKGPCGKQLMPPGPWPGWWPHVPPTLSALSCMHLYCPAECSDNFSGSDEREVSRT